MSLTCAVILMHLTFKCMQVRDSRGHLWNTCLQVRISCLQVRSSWLLQVWMGWTPPAASPFSQLSSFCAIRRSFDLGQFERFRRIMHTPPFTLLVCHDSATLLSSLQVGLKQKRMWAIQCTSYLGCNYWLLMDDNNIIFIGRSNCIGHALRVYQAIQCLSVCTQP